MTHWHADWLEAHLAKMKAIGNVEIVRSLGKPKPTGAAKPAQSGSTPDVRSILRSARLPEPIAEFRFHPSRRWRFDFAWPAHKLALEIEGGIWTQGRHTRGSGAIADLEKYSEAAILGWRLLYATPDEAESGVMLDRVTRALE